MHYLILLFCTCSEYVGLVDFVSVGASGLIKYNASAVSEDFLGFLGDLRLVVIIVSSMQLKIA